jgi:hypothetical protein
MTMELLDLSRRFAQLPAGKRKAFMARLRTEGLDFDALPMIPREPDAPAPLAAAQRALWLAWQRAPLSPAYNLAGRLRITGGLSAQTIQAALRRLVERHAVLRTRYALDADGSAVQLVRFANRLPTALKKTCRPCRPKARPSRRSPSTSSRATSSAARCIASPTA